LKITNTYCTTRGRTASAKCTQCGCRQTIVQFVADVGVGQGHGAAAVARKIREGQIVPVLKEKTS
jgi:hypothetical protein